MDHKEKYNKLVNAIKVLQEANPSDETIQNFVNDNVPELAESEDEKMREELIRSFKSLNTIEIWNGIKRSDILAWLEKQGERKEANLVEILKRYPKETELYSPLYGRLWLAEVDEKNEIITCYKHRLEEGCTRAVLKQEDTVSFYSNGTTGLPDFNTSKDCMLFLYDIAKQGEQKPTWSHEDDVMVNDIIRCLPVKSRPEYNQRRANWIKSLKGRVQPKQEWSEEDEKMFRSLHNLIYVVRDCDCDSSKKKELSDWIESLKNRMQPQEWSEEDKDMIQALDACIDATIKSGMNYISFDSKSILIGKVKKWLKSFKQRTGWKPSDEQITWLYRATDEAKKDSRMKQVLNELLYDLKKLKGE